MIKSMKNSDKSDSLHVDRNDPGMRWKTDLSGVITVKQPQRRIVGYNDSP